MSESKKWIEKLSLEAHPEGGFYKETYRSWETGQFSGFEGTRNISTAIYFMLTKDNFSAFHKIKSDEMWHFYHGSAIVIYVIDLEGRLQKLLLGTDIEKGQRPQHLVKAGCWFASRIEEEGDYALTGCTVAPGFDFRDFVMAERNQLVADYPAYKDLIKSLTR
ncbi:cupin domain-containing protein [Fulvivirga sp. RKSG066]|uniref:cupin domain-containing protein n=1 Tax=Fulvivirga aurantia TaxID=2529383 RepID=UPI0012BD17E5|nr:cupin domain-containing protein [Fulvivirga aurantia]MTI22644.1 cupin domain-containing protein [Fulvivirga aurantia]